MSIYLGVGKKDKECRDTIKEKNVTYVLQFLSKKGKSVFGDETPPEGVTIVVVQQDVIADPTRNESWSGEEIDKMIGYVMDVLARLQKGEVVMIVCNAGMNRSRVVACIVARLLGDNDMINEMPLPDDDALKEFVNIFNTNDSLMRDMMLAEVHRKGITGAPRPKRARKN